MSTIKIKHREFEIIEEKSDNSLLVSHKGKEYIVEKFDYSKDEGKAFVYALQRIKSAGISAPKVFVLDKKAGLVVKEKIDGTLVSELLAEKDLDEKVIEQLFLIAYLAKINRMTLNYNPDNWMWSNDKLYYIKTDFIEYAKEKDLVTKYIRLWFSTKEANEFLSKIGLNIDKNRLKNEYLINKQIVLMTCKYYK